jgi:hypothetical protein
LTSALDDLLFHAFLDYLETEPRFIGLVETETSQESEIVAPDEFWKQEAENCATIFKWLRTPIDRSELSDRIESQFGKTILLWDYDDIGDCFTQQTILEEYKDLIYRCGMIGWYDYLYHRDSDKISPRKATKIAESLRLLQPFVRERAYDTTDFDDTLWIMEWSAEHNEPISLI